MKRYRFSYFIGQSFKGLWRNGIMTVASITVLMSCLVVIGSFALLITNIDTNLEQLGLLNEIAVFVDETKTDEEVAAIGEKIKTLDNVADVTFISKEQALEEEKERYPDYAELYDIVADDNPLRDSFIITYEELAGTPTLQYELEHNVEGIANVTAYFETAAKIEDARNSISLVLLWFMVILFAVSVFVIINTIKLAVHARKDEISVMRYVGATNWFVMLPFVFEGIIIGALSSICAFFAQWYLYKYVINMMDGSFDFITIIGFDKVGLPLAGLFMAIGIITGIIGSTISTRKHLKA